MVRFGSFLDMLDLETSRIDLCVKILIFSFFSEKSRIFSKQDAKVGDNNPYKTENTRKQVKPTVGVTPTTHQLFSYCGLSLFPGNEFNKPFVYK